MRAFEDLNEKYIIIENERPLRIKFLLNNNDTNWIYTKQVDPNRIRICNLEKSLTKYDLRDIFKVKFKN